MRKVTLIAMLALCALFVVGAVAQADNKPAFNVDWYGYFKLDGAYDQNLTSHGNFVMWVEPRTYSSDDEQFNMTANQTRLGVKLNGQGYDDVKVNGNIEFDLYANVAGGVDQNKAMLQLRHAYFSVEKNNFKLTAGQTWDMVSPLNPATLNYAVLWGCGNIGYRRPQVSMWYKMQPGSQTSVDIGGGFFRTIGTDLTPSFTLSLGETTDGPDDGTDNAIPTFQGIVDVKHNWTENGWFRAGVSGMWGQMKAETNLGGSEKYESWVASGHLMISFPQGYGFSGEVFSGTNLAKYNGGILQASTIDGVDAQGGWVSAWAKVAPKFKLGAGYGLDDPKDEDISAGRAKNTCYYGNIIYSFIPQASVGLEVSQWETEYVGAESAKNLRAQTSFILNF